MRLVAVATVVLAFAVSTMACSAGTAGGGTNGNQTGGGAANGGTAANNGTAANGGNGGTAANGTGGATCDDACALYLGCKGIDTTDNRTACDAECTRQNHPQSDLTQFVALDCQTAVALIDPPPANNNQGGSSGSSCDRCVWDGSSCIWMSPNAPVTPACDANCCPGH